MSYSNNAEINNFSVSFIYVKAGIYYQNDPSREVPVSLSKEKDFTIQKQRKAKQDLTALFGC